ncbi:MAG TPA: DUF4440 domain-containing protein [Patescibacteria group bacterium]|nr:DUF4440 domain-containing protein [Patescibacteria group bacterium]
MQEQHQRVCTALQNAWQNKDFELLKTALAPNLQWYEGSYEAALTTADAVVAQWQKDLATQSNIKVEVVLLDFVEGHGYYHCRANWQRSDSTLRESDGIFVAYLNETGQITYFNQWWTGKS